MKKLFLVFAVVFISTCSQAQSRSDFYGTWTYQGNDSVSNSKMEYTITATTFTAVYTVNINDLNPYFAPSPEITVWEIFSWENITNEDTRTRRDYPDGFLIGLRAGLTNEVMRIYIHRDKDKFICDNYIFYKDGTPRQEHTFEGLPWGSTKEQVISKLGKPSGGSGVDLTEGRFYFDDVSVSGYMSQLSFVFDEHGMMSAFYHIYGNDLNASQLKTAYTTITRQLTEKYGHYSEIIKRGYIQDMVWHFDNFHILVETNNDHSSSILIHYYPNYVWNIFEKYEEFIRLPNNE